MIELRALASSSFPFSLLSPFGSFSLLILFYPASCSQVAFPFTQVLGTRRASAKVAQGLKENLRSTSRNFPPVNAGGLFSLDFGGGVLLVCRHRPRD